MRVNFQKKRLRITDVLLIVIAWVGGMGLIESTLAPAAAAREIDAKKGIIQKAMKLQTPFIANQGQLNDKRVRFYAQTFGGTLFITAEGEMVYSFATVEPRAKEGEPVVLKPQAMKGWALKERLVGALNVRPGGIERSATKVNSFIGNDRSKWKTNIDTYNAVSLGEVYKGIDLCLKVVGNSVEKIFTVQPGVDLKAIRLKMEGAVSLNINHKGELESETGIGMLSFSKPIAYQEKDGKRKSVQVAYNLKGDAYGFEVGEYDRSRPIIIDPVLSYSTYLGSSGTDRATDIHLDAAGHVFVTGNTSSTNFPIAPGAYPDIYGGGTYGGGIFDGFVTKLSADGSKLLYSIYLGGSGAEVPTDIEIDSAGNVYVTGYTTSTDFPITPDAVQKTFAGGVDPDPFDSFVMKFNPDGSDLIYSTYLGGSGNDFSINIDVDAAGNAYATGSTSSMDFTFPNTTGFYQEEYGGGTFDGFITKLSADGSAFIYSTYLGKQSEDRCVDIEVDAVGNVYVTGGTSSSIDFPITDDAFQPTYGGGDFDGIVAKLSADGSALLFSTYFGGSGRDFGSSISLDSADNVYVTGWTRSIDFPIEAAVQPTYGGGLEDAYVIKLNADGSDLIYSTYLGGSDQDFGIEIASDAAGNAYATGGTSSNDFPIEAAVQPTYGGDEDAYVTKLSAGGSALSYSTYIGGSNREAGGSIALDAVGNVYIAGGTGSSDDFPTTSGAFQETYGEGEYDAFIAKILDEPDNLPPFPVGHAPIQGQTNVAIDANIVVHVRDDGAGVDLSTIILTVEDTIVYDGSDPDSYPNTVVTGNLTDFTLTYDPPADFGHEQPVNVVVQAADLAGNDIDPLIYSFMTEPAAGDPWEPPPDDSDDDEDGIPNRIETDLLGTNPNGKTLFVRPKQFDGSAFVYWPGFIVLFPDARSGFAGIPAFSHAGIEISVIGDPGHPYTPMRAFDYDPAADANQPPCDILEIIHMTDNVYCTFGHHNFGHTYFYTIGTTWYWDTKGYVPNDQTSPHYLEHRYFTPYIYPFPLDNYLNEGAYPHIDMNQWPEETTGCGLKQCYDTGYSSPLNLSDSEAAPPYTQRPDGTVEFNQIVFDSNKQIIFVGSQGIRYDREKVMRRTLTHEMGHALLAASEADHCTDDHCIMYHSVADWEMRDFGPGDCVHKPGGSKDIRGMGVVHNSVH